MSFYLVRLHIENFKLFSNIELDFSEANLFVMDGPNGFGKTSIYDAIELLLTKKIQRIENNKVFNRPIPHNDSIYYNDPNKPIIIKGEFSDGKKKYTLASYLAERNKLQDLTATEFSPENFKPFEWRKLINFSSPIEEGETITHKHVNEIFGS